LVFLWLFGIFFPFWFVVPRRIWHPFSGYGRARELQSLPVRYLSTESSQILSRDKREFFQIRYFGKGIQFQMEIFQISAASKNVTVEKMLGQHEKEFSIFQPINRKDSVAFRVTGCVCKKVDQNVAQFIFVTINASILPWKEVAQ
jgi:hypothetical protein